MMRDIRKLLEEYKAGKTTLDEVLEEIRKLPYSDLGYAKVDTHRTIRKGFPETIFCVGKTIEQILGILEKLLQHNNNILLTKANREIYEAVKKHYPDAEYNEVAKTIVFERKKIEPIGRILIVTAGTSDIPVAEEAAVTIKLMGCDVEKIYDVGAAGVHRLLDILEKLSEVSVVIVVAGMDGVLPSIVGGLTSKPVIAVPTSIGYGASFQGLSALLTMLNSCAEGVVVVNIDNGFGAGYFASLITREMNKR
ncbi:MAG TPA: nickel pincer cofactor biosynthesis protein LarB [Thermoplasmatales archaeon]|nr:nickel pincer cofactor biosynthesis protein LarB [Thermoplasmatales archaeon]